MRAGSSGVGDKLKNSFLFFWTRSFMVTVTTLGAELSAYLGAGLGSQPGVI